MCDIYLTIGKQLGYYILLCKSSSLFSDSYCPHLLHVTSAYKLQVTSYMIIKKLLYMRIVLYNTIVSFHI